MAVETPAGQGRIKKLDIFKDVVWVQYADGSWADLPLEDVRGYLGLKQGEPLRRRSDSTPGSMRGDQGQA